MYFAVPKSHELNYIRESIREGKEDHKDKNSIKVIKAPKFSQKACEKSMKLSGKSGRNQSKVDNNFCFVFQPNQQNVSSQPNEPKWLSKGKVRLSFKRNSMVVAPPSFQIQKEIAQKFEKSKKKKITGNKERPSISKSRLKVNMKNNDSKDNAKSSPSKKLNWADKHKRINSDQIPEFENLYDPNVDEPNVATERHTTSLIDNLDQSEFIKNVIIQSNKPGCVRFGSPGQANPSTSNSAQVEKK